MSFDIALRSTEILLALALIQSSAEHLRTTPRIFIPRLALSLALLAGYYAPQMLALLSGLNLIALWRFQGPYNGGTDRMSTLTLLCITLIHWIPSEAAQQIIFGYLALQLVWSYVMAGLVKIVNPEWRSGRALQDVFRFSIYPASENLRVWTDRPRALLTASWAVMLLEILFPLFLLSQATLVIGLSLAMLFHLSNAYFFGLNRFVWAWLAAYPSLLWLQQLL